MELKDFITALLQSGLFGTFGFPVFNYLESKWPWLQTSAEFWMRRAIAWALACLLAWFPYLVAVVMLYLPAPTTWREWVERLFSVAFIGVTAAQGLHSAYKSKQARV